MKKIILYSLVILTLVLCVSCKSDRYSNPKLIIPQTFTLDTPEAAAQTMDLENSEAFIFSCHHPDYGFNAAISYELEVCLDEKFEEGKVKKLDDSFKTNIFKVKSRKLAVTLTKLLIDKGNAPDKFPLTHKFYLRAKASIDGKYGVVNSNSIELNSKTYFALPPAVLPEKLYMIGAFCDWDWAKAVEMVPVHDHPELYWRMVYLPEKGGFKFNRDTKWDNHVVSYDNNVNITVDKKLDATISSDGDKNIVINKGGWYLVVMKVTMENYVLKHELSILSPNVYIIGPATKDKSSWGGKEENLMMVPKDSNGDFVSNELHAATEAGGGLRAAIVLEGIDWWRTEFMVFDGELKYRGKGGDQNPRVNCGEGDKLYINFTTGKGRIERKK